jgi:hypothetical protein
MQFLCHCPDSQIRMSVLDHRVLYLSACICNTNLKLPVQTELSLTIMCLLYLESSLSVDGDFISKDVKHIEAYYALVQSLF